MVKFLAQISIKITKNNKMLVLLCLNKVYFFVRESLCQLFFIIVWFFYQMVTLHKLWKMFFSFSRYSNFSKFFRSIHTFPIQWDKLRWNNLWCYKLVCINLQMYFWNTSKIALHYIIKPGIYLVIFGNLFCNINRNWSLFPGPF